MQPLKAGGFPSTRQVCRSTQDCICQVGFYSAGERSVSWDGLSWSVIVLKSILLLLPFAFEDFPRFCWLFLPVVFGVFASQPRAVHHIKETLCTASKTAWYLIEIERINITTVMEATTIVEFRRWASIEGELPMREGGASGFCLTWINYWFFQTKTCAISWSFLLAATCYLSIFYYFRNPFSSFPSFFPTRSLRPFARPS